jgi:hypothetical protein
MEVEWNLRLMREVIEDGNPEFCSGDVFRWGVDFQCETPLAIAPEEEIRAVLVEKNCYRVHARVIYISRDPKYDCCVLDFGISALSESGSLLGMPLLPECREGDYVAGLVWLFLPLCSDIQPYKIGHKWRVNRITAESGDFYSTPRGLGEIEAHEVPGTGSLKAESYILHCSHVAGPAMVGGKPPIDEKALKYLNPI